MNREDLTSKVIAPIVVALISLIGGLSGVLIGGHLSTEAENDRLKINYKNEILQQRIRLIDRAASIYGKAPGIRDVWVEYLKSDNDKPKGNLELSEKLADYNSEFNAVINLSGIYFGPETRKALTAMAENSSPWWEKDGKLVNQYLGAMASELKYGFE